MTAIKMNILLRDKASNATENSEKENKADSRSAISGSDLVKTDSDDSIHFPENVVTDQEEIIKLSGIVPEHFPGIQEVATETGCIIAFRPVEPVATQLIAEDYPTKNFHIKGKSSNWGPMAGFIPVDQSLSKLENQPDKIDNANKKTQECLGEKHAISGPLVISSNRLQFLLKQGTLQQQGNVLETKGPGGGVYRFHFSQYKDDPERFEITQSNGFQNEPVQVLCDPDTKQPLTADYDLMLVAPQLKDYDNQDKARNPETSFENFKHERKHYRTPVQESKQEFYAREDPNLGNVTKRVEKLIGQLNKKLKGDTGNKVVHHNMDATSPASDPAGNYPVTLFLPQLHGVKETTVLARNKKEFAEIITWAKDTGFHVPLNPLWEDGLNSIKRTSFRQGQINVETLLEKRSKSATSLPDIPDNISIITKNPDSNRFISGNLSFSSSSLGDSIPSESEETVYEEQQENLTVSELKKIANEKHPQDITISEDSEYGENKDFIFSEGYSHPASIERYNQDQRHLIETKFKTMARNLNNQNTGSKKPGEGNPRFMPSSGHRKMPGKKPPANSTLL